VVAQERDAGVLQAGLERAAAGLAEDRQAEWERTEDLDRAADPARPETFVDEHRQLERCRRARVRGAEDADDQSPIGEGLDRRPGAVSLGQVVHVDAALAEARDPVGIPLGAECDDERVGIPAVSIDLRRPLGRMDRTDRPCHHPDAPVAQERQRSFALDQGVRVEHGPVLAKTHDERRPPLDEEDLVGRIKLPAKGDRCGDPAEPSAEDQDAV